MNELDKLRDIKPLMEIGDYSFVILILTIIAVSGTLSIGIYYLIGYLKVKKERDKRDFYHQKLKKMDIQNSKQCAYTITKYGKFLVKEEKEREFLERLNQNLEMYKYTNTPPSLSKKDKKMIEEFIRIVNV